MTRLTYQWQSQQFTYLVGICGFKGVKMNNSDGTEKKGVEK